MAALKVLLDERLMDSVKQKEEQFRSLLVHPKIKSVRSFGLWLAVEFDSFESNKKITDSCIDPSTGSGGVMTDWFLFASGCLRISPPLIINEEQIKKACRIILEAIENS